jgi:hypothetical protein
MFISPIFGDSDSDIDVGDIVRSLRFRGAQRAQTSEFQATAIQDTYTFGIWVKRAVLGTEQVIFGVSTTSGLKFTTGDLLQLLTPAGTLNSTAVFRDTTGWMFILYTQEGTAVNVYVNGVLVITGTLASIQFNTASVHYLGATSTGTLFFQGYMARALFVDGAVVPYTSFIYLNSSINEWVTKRKTEILPLVDSGGINSFLLDFNQSVPAGSLGLDSSVHATDWTTTAISLTLGADYDWMADVPGNSFATLNSLYTTASTLTKGNLTASGTTDLPTLIPASGTWYFEISEVSQTWTPPAAFPGGAGNYNFGQRPFTNSPTALTLCQANLPATAIYSPKTNFDIALATGASIKTTTALFFSGNYLNWIKDRANTNNHQLIDTVRGDTAVLRSNTTGAETTYIAPAGISVGWAWKAGGAAVANNAGTIASQVSPNIEAGFSVVTYTGTGVAGTVGHGLNKPPELVIVKNRDSGTFNWAVWHSALLGTQYLRLNTVDARATGTAVWNSTVPTATVFSIGTDVAVNVNTSNFLAYCFASVEGYSKIGKYTGNGNAVGPFVELGFKPAFVLIKRSGAASSAGWYVLDFERSANNVVAAYIVPNSTAAEVTAVICDFTATGFRLRTTGSDLNSSGADYVYAAFAEVQGKYSLAR